MLAWLASMKARGEAHFSEAGGGLYMTAGALFELRDGGQTDGQTVDLSRELLAVLTALN